ncbi:hypothetical protein JCM19000A_24520 [Silvimonas sp. JCM 19000]
MLMPRPRQAGFSLIELMVAMSVFAIMLVIAIPAFGTWITNTRMRSAAEELQNGLNGARSSALQLNRTVQFSLAQTPVTASATPAASNSNARYWYALTIPVMSSDSAAVVKSGNFGNDRVTVSGPTTLSFSPVGRMVITTDNTSGLNKCTAPSNGTVYELGNADGSTNQDIRHLCVTVNNGGKVRMCDPNKTLSTTNPDGC